MNIISIRPYFKIMSIIDILFKEFVDSSHWVSIKDLIAKRKSSSSSLEQQRIHVYIINLEFVSLAAIGFVLKGKSCNSLLK